MRYLPDPDRRQGAAHGGMHLGPNLRASSQQAWQVRQHPIWNGDGNLWILVLAFKLGSRFRQYLLENHESLPVTAPEPGTSIRFVSVTAVEGEDRKLVNPTPHSADQQRRVVGSRSTLVHPAFMETRKSDNEYSLSFEC